MYTEHRKQADSPSITYTLAQHKHELHMRFNEDGTAHIYYWLVDPGRDNDSIVYLDFNSDEISNISQNLQYLVTK